MSSSASPPPKVETGAGWTFLTNHSHVLICLLRNPEAVLRDVAYQVGITERAVQRIVADLERGGVLNREKLGRRNRYEINVNVSLRHPLEQEHTVLELLERVVGPKS